MRTPLNAILGFGQLLELEDLTSTQQQSVRHILGGGRHLLGVVDEVLDLARIEHGKTALCPEDIDLGPLFAEIAGLMAPLARERDVRLHWKESGGTATAPGTAHVYADRQRLRQVLLNLVANAVKYNRPTGGEVFLSASVPISPERTLLTKGGEASPCNRVRLTVRDTGAGMVAEDVAKLFVPFERLGAAYGPIKGTGLGLAVSKQIVEAMHGAIGAESMPGLGSTFWVELPLLAAPVDQEASETTFSTSPRQLGESLLAGTEQAGEVTGSTSAPPTLLYVEDNSTNRDLVAHVLAAYRPDLRLLLAHDAEEGLVLARRTPGPHLILLDLNLPGVSGEVALARLRSDPRTAAVPVVILSGDATARTRERLLAVGTRAYLSKPFDVRQFLVLVNELLPAFSTPEKAAVIGAQSSG